MKGLRIKEIRLGDGQVAEKGMMAVIRYDCYLPQGDRCDVGGLHVKVGEDRDTFVALPPGVLGMKVGGIRELKVSPQLAYRERAKNPTIPASAALRYEVTLLSVERQPRELSA